ncbi:hypothetical protein BKP37_03990 [Anaerobacillus alkalilacustris]|uniref:Uncharacterized protein n=1 Tax=Anaerobacillus alkalilacustris TaxID=393763 RepID=A0A1S2LYR6_9BACI|nr:hypothetical protein BKP37_03990 [Anaerobacillus alkalilacustris]
MKTMLLFLLFFTLSLIVALIFDLLLGLSIHSFFRNIVITFMVMDLPEYLLFFSLFILVIIKPLTNIVKKIKN